MRLAVITDEISQEFEHALDVMLEYEVRGAELRGLWGTNVADLTPAQIAQARLALQSRGMTVPCLSTPVFKCDLRTNEAAEKGPLHLATVRTRSEQPELLRRCAGIAQSFGTTLIRVFAFWKQGDLSPEIEREIVDAFGELLPVAEQEGVTLALENEHACFIGTGSEAARIIEAVGSPRLRAVWDPGNSLHAGEKPFPDGYNALKPHIAHIHVKDVEHDPGTGELRWAVMGAGEVGYAAHFEALRNDGYRDFVALETHYKPESGSAEEGSRLCLQALRELIKD